MAAHPFWGCAGLRTLAAIWIGMLAVPGIAGASEDQPASETTPILEHLLEQVAAHRGVAKPPTPRLRVVSGSELTELLRTQPLKEPARSLALRRQAQLEALGLWPATFDILRALSDEVPAAAPAGFYDPDLETLYYVVSDLPVLNRLRRFTQRRDEVLTHELIHYFQHRTRPELFDRAEETRWSLDLSLAVHALIEGQASVQASRVFGFDASWSASAGIGEEDFWAPVPADDAGPPIVLRMFSWFPYVFGARDAALNGELSWLLMPASTEQLLHVEKRFDAFSSIDLGRVGFLANGCEVVHESTAGELLISVLFRELGASALPEPGGVAYQEQLHYRARAWEGWDGDRFLVGRCDGRPELYWLTLWDSEHDALEFEEAYRGIAEKANRRAGRTEPLRIHREGRRVEIHSPGLDPMATQLGAGARVVRTSTYDEVTAVRRIGIAAARPDGVPGRP